MKSGGELAGGHRGHCDGHDGDPDHRDGHDVDCAAQFVHIVMVMMVIGDDSAGTHLPHLLLRLDPPGGKTL